MAGLSICERIGTIGTGAPDTGGHNDANGICNRRRCSADDGCFNFCSICTEENNKARRNQDFRGSVRNEHGSFSAGTERSFGRRTGTAAGNWPGAGRTNRFLPQSNRMLSEPGTAVGCGGIGTATYAAIVDLLYLTKEYDLSDPAEPETEESQVVPEVSEAEPGNVPEESPQEPVTEAEMQPVDLNTASRKELMQIPDMTPELAEEILQFRQENQYFSSVYELLYLEHMTDSYFQKIREKIVVLSK